MSKTKTARLTEKDGTVSEITYSPGDSIGSVIGRLQAEAAKRHQSALDDVTESAKRAG